MLSKKLENYYQPYDKSSPLIKWYLDSIKEEHILSNAGYKFLKRQHLYRFENIKTSNCQEIPLFENKDLREREDFAGYTYNIGNCQYLVSDGKIFNMKSWKELSKIDSGFLFSNNPVFIHKFAFHFDFSTLFDKPMSKFSELEMRAFELFKPEVHKIVDNNLVLMKPTTYEIRPLREHSGESDGIIYNSAKGLVYIDKNGQCYNVSGDFKILEPINYTFDNILNPLLSVYKYELEH